ncbi:4-aminobutyrate aminotransferase-like enzyme/Ser/Thr protein kinase RdoA (MazF antagonist) [Streptomyces sp. SAI-117]|uniref:aminotransferase n=1 Tax=Streptomyces sp. SAI-117 TaxID=2940546 RepID=UPI0024734460|nr:aminotransferase [Streptomyces sp. SAI-117]MDH6566012.1 4-aminobutyrate aminotransferase-like enzyme/Ser/Thr protein kinase RdoA (MazF antagonist) [Streptomyces sp. SAI-117]
MPRKRSGPMGLPSTDWLVRPVAPIDETAAAAVLATRFGVRGTVRDLGSQQDRNYRVRSEAGEYVLKVANPATGTGELRAQCDAVEHLAGALPGLRLPRALPGADGDVVQPFPVDGAPLDCRLLEFVPGEPIMDSGYLAPAVVARLGDIAGRIAAALADFTAPEPDRFRPWDLRNALAVTEALAPHWPDRARADRVLSAARTAYALVEPHAKDLPVQFVHGDITDNNVVCETARDGRRMPVGVIDFGDLGTGWTVAEAAVTCTSVLHHHGAGPASVLPAVRAFDAVRPLLDEEVAVLWPLVVLRAAVMVVSGQYDVLQDPDNGYASAALDREWAMFESAVSVPAQVMTAGLREALGRPLPRVAVRPAHRMLPGLPDAVPVLDLSAQSDDLHSGRWLAADAEAALVAGRPAVRTRHGEFRLTRTTLDTTDAPATCALGVDLRPADPLEVRAPWPGTLTRHADGTLDLRGEGHPVLWLYGVTDPAAPGPVAAGQRLGSVAGQDGGHTLGLQLSTLTDRRPPRFATPDLAAGWLAVSPDPTALITGQDPAKPSADKDLLDRRDRAFAGVQEHYYDEPPRIERGWRHHLVDTRGRGYLDMLNNVTILGHGHPALSDAVHRQWRRLNTNSRFHYGSVVELSERLTALLPAELDTVFLVNSGSEAVDLALRLAWAATGRQDTVAVEEAYHGWTYASDAVSTSIADNPNALSSRPGWVHTVAAPNSYRGRHRGAEARRYGPEAAARITALADQGHPPAAFICEPFYGNAGGLPLPDGYLRHVYDATRAVGGLCIADEVQVGYGRLGTHFWGFEQQGVVPDVVTVAKAMGNGHPLGAVITRREIADAYRTQGYFFSSAGGSPVSSVVGLTVLDVLRDERLQDNAVRTGGYLKRRLEELAERHPLIGAVHGSGLYLGVEFVRDRETLEPATEETAAICDRLRELGVIVQPTSDRQCVLKIKPPLCLTRHSADVFTAALDDVLTHGW